jgi:hypothetical protein
VGSWYHEESPDGVVGEDGAGEDEHCEAYEAVELVGFGWLVGLVVFGWFVVGCFLLGCWRPCLEGVGLVGWMYLLLRAIVWVRIDVRG